MDVTLLPQVAFMFLLIFARIGTMVMLMPALGEQGIPTRIRLGIALSMTLVMYPMASAAYPAQMPPTVLGLVTLAAGEFIVGFFVGLAARLVLSAMVVAGSTIASQSGLAMAQAFDPAQGTQGVIFGNFLSIFGITMIFVTDLHHLVVAGIHGSYTLFPPGEWMPVGDLAKYAVMTVADAFRVGIQISTPFLAFGLIFYLGLGILNRLMPQIQIFFVAMPANIAMGVLLLFLLLGTLITWYLSHVEDVLNRFVAG